MRAVAVRSVLVAALVGAVLALPASQGSATVRPMRLSQLTDIQNRLVSGLASTEFERASTTTRRPAPRTEPLQPALGSTAARFYVPGARGSCAYRIGRAVNMDQDCQNVTDPDLGGRAQAQNETYVSEDPFRPGRLLGSSNDYRRGDGGCFGYTSSDGGRHFGDVAGALGVPPRGPPHPGGGPPEWAPGGGHPPPL